MINVNVLGARVIGFASVMLLIALMLTQTHPSTYIPTAFLAGWALTYKENR